MRKRFMDFICCPECSGDLKLEATKVSRNQITEGKLKCLCGKEYPIIKGVPRMIDFPTDNLVDKEIRGVVNIQKSFQKEWSNFDYSDKTWGWDLEERKNLFLKEMDIDARILKNKTLLDAGCGNGTLTIGLSDFGLEVIGMDLTDIVERAEEHNRSSNVHFIQGDIMKPPFKEGSFDFVYSSGVIHHTPSPHNAFKRLIKVGGSRIYVWVYWKRGLKDTIALFVSKITSKFPLSVQHLIYLFLTLIFQIRQKILLSFNPEKVIAKTWSERMVWFYDSLSHKYQSRHSPEEVFNWFKESNLSNIKLTEKRKNGFGICGEKLL